MGALGMSQPRISRQLAVLKRGELVINSRKGNWIYYKINPKLPDKGIEKDILAQLSKWLNHDEIAKSDGLALRACLKQQETTGNCDLKSFLGVREKVVNK
jgi:ArsR family transcriptional regulator